MYMLYWREPGDTKMVKYARSENLAYLQRKMRELKLIYPSRIFIIK